MTTASPFKKVLLLDASGSIRRHVLQALLTEPTLTVTILKRASSSKTTTLPERKTSPASPSPTPTPAPRSSQAFRGQDVVVINCLTTNGALRVRPVSACVDAAVARPAGVRPLRVHVPSERFLQKWEGGGGVEWTSVSCGMWIRWSMRNEVLGMHVKEKRFEVWDGGEGRGLVGVPEGTRNRNTQKKLLAEIERQMGETLAVDAVDSEKRIAELQEACAKGDVSATYGLIEAGFVTGRYGGDLGKEGEIFTEKLALKRHSLQEVVADALACL
ncbi:hypothetical protein C8A00DRAFT_46769 [Chaetomidium leptoderma]|uniref:NmrA-like domain-containing protein n=1 Tax=Chaetomidium leptoderma TaxID=669021 RepID=A0AAN6VDV9_9PEZI|nr:hypothetical protein C8A00DRAFT_46769 [Chaetomidium leptoderma]